MPLHGYILKRAFLIVLTYVEFKLKLIANEASKVVLKSKPVIVVQFLFEDQNPID